MSDGPAELAHPRSAGGRDVGDGQGEGPEAGPAVEADEDQCPHAGGQQAGGQHHADQSATDPRRLEQQEGPGQRRDEQGGDGGEAARRPDHQDGHVGGVALDEVDDGHGQPPAHHDQRGLRPEDGAQAQGDQRRHEDPGHLPERGQPAGLEPLGGKVAAGAGQVVQRQPHQQPAEGEDRQRPPRWDPVEAQSAGQGGEEPVVQAADQLEEEVGEHRHRDAHDRPEDQQHHVAATLQEGQRGGRAGGRRGGRRRRWTGGRRGRGHSGKGA